MTEASTGIITGAFVLASNAFAFIGGLVAQGARTKRHEIASAGTALDSIITGMEAQRAELAKARDDHHECLERATRLEVRLARVESRVGMPPHEADGVADEG